MPALYDKMLTDMYKQQKTRREDIFALISRDQLQQILDEQIHLWRERMDRATTDYAVEAAGHYIDAYQYIREVFIGEMLAIDDEEQ